jgi:hypothetical protein
VNERLLAQLKKKKPLSFSDCKSTSVVGSQARKVFFTALEIDLSLTQRFSFRKIKTISWHCIDHKMVRVLPNLVLLAMALPGSLGFTTPCQTVGRGVVNFPTYQVNFRRNRYLTTTNTPMSTSTPPISSRNQNWPLGMLGGLGNSAASWTIPSAILETLFHYHGNVPFLPSFVLNLVLFFLIRTKLLKMLTPQGFAHGVALGTMLWTTLGWRGWSLTVLYLFLGSAVTKVRFSDKEKRGIAESRGGRRGPENLWYEKYCQHMFLLSKYLIFSF